MYRECKELKAKIQTRNYIIMALVALILAMVGANLYDEHDYKTHMEYERRNNCTWEYDRFGDWTVCK